jgi:hypothetical protein
MDVVDRQLGKTRMLAQDSNGKSPQSEKTGGLTGSTKATHYKVEEPAELILPCWSLS